MAESLKARDVAADAGRIKPIAADATYSAVWITAVFIGIEQVTRNLSTVEEEGRV